MDIFIYFAQCAVLHAHSPQHPPRNAYPATRNTCLATRASQPATRQKRSEQSISRILFPVQVTLGPGNDHSSEDGGCPPSLATYPEARTGSPQTLPYLVLHRVGFAELPRSPGELVRSYRTISPLPVTKPAGSADRRYTFCCTFLRVATTSCYEAPCPAVFGLSSRSRF